MIRYIREQYSPSIKIICIEPYGSDCLYQSMLNQAKSNIDSCPPTEIVGLDCGVLSDIAYPIMSSNIDATVKVKDEVTFKGVRYLHQ